MNPNFFRYLLTFQILILDEELLNQCKDAQDYSKIAVEIFNLDVVNTPGFELDFFEVFPNLSFVRITQIDTKSLNARKYDYHPEVATKVYFIPFELINQSCLFV